MRFTHKVIIVTGAASGIGQRTAKRLASEGATVVACDMNAITCTDAGITPRRLDVTREDDWRDTVEWVMANYGRLDGLVNAAGIIRMGNVVDSTLDDFRLMMAVNVEGTFLGCKYALRAMRDAGEGSIVNLSSTAGLCGAAGAAAYCASKGAVRLLTKSVALEAIAIPSRVRVNSVHPAMTDTPMAQAIVDQLGGAEEVREAMRAMMPSGRFATVDEIASAILFLLSDEASYMNGSEMVVDNGFSAQ